MAEDWWYERRTLVRQLLSIGDARRAYEAAAWQTLRDTNHRDRP